MTTTDHHRWLLDRLGHDLGPEVARGALQGCLQQLGLSAGTLNGPQCRELLRGPLHVRLRDALGRRGAAAWVERAERERFGPEDVASASHTTHEALRHPLLLGRRVGDLGLGLARLRLELAQRGLRRLERTANSPASWRLAARHEVERGQAELGRAEATHALLRARDTHLRALAWLEYRQAHQQHDLNALLLADALERQAAADELALLHITLRQGRDLVTQLDLLGLKEPDLEAPPPVSPEPEAWLPLLERHPQLLLARQACDLGQVGALNDLEATRRTLTRALHARLNLLRDLAQRREAARDALRAAEASAARSGTSPLALTRARQAVMQCRSAWLRLAYEAHEAQLELRIFLGHGPGTPS